MTRPLRSINRTPWCAAALWLTTCDPRSTAPPPPPQPQPQPPAQAADWREDWEAEAGFALAVDTRGYRFPVNLAFVPSPGPGPKDPLYFVVELRGTVKVVTNDRTVAVFADGLTNFQPEEELPAIKGESGAAGLCLDAERGHVFVTYVYLDRGGVLRNGLVRFDTLPRVFGTKPLGRKSLDHVFASDPANISHQIGPCQVHQGHLFVSVGDAERTHASLQVTSTLGKILRMTADGLPADGNPFAQDRQPGTPMNHVWAYGFRNPFGLKILDGRLFVTDNGPKVDRFGEVRAGESHFYDGSNASIAARAAYVWAPAVSPVAIDHAAGRPDLPPSHRRRFFVALSGSPGDPLGPGHNGQKSVVSFDYDFDRGRLDGVPRPLLRYRGPGRQLVVGLAFGPDGLYVVPLLPGRDGVSAILRATYAPDAAHPYGLADMAKYRADPELLMTHKGCMSCHRTDDGGESVAPSLDRRTLGERIARRLASPEYLASLPGLDAVERQLGRSFRAERERVLKARGTERVRLWVKFHLLEPLFDNATAQMPNMGLTEEEATLITDHLVQALSLKDRVYLQLDRLLGAPRHRHWMVAFALGVALSSGAALARRRRRR
jgi:hypothetical protein